MKRFAGMAALTKQSTTTEAAKPVAPPLDERPLRTAALAGGLQGAVPNTSANWLLAGVPDDMTSNIINLMATGLTGAFAGAFVGVITYQRKARQTAAAATEPTEIPPFYASRALRIGLVCAVTGALLSILIGSLVVGLPGNELTNVLQHAVLGYVTGLLGGYFGLRTHLRRQNASPPAVGAVGQAH